MRDLMEAYRADERMRVDIMLGKVAPASGSPESTVGVSQIVTILERSFDSTALYSQHSTHR